MVDERGHRTSGWRRLRVSGVLALALMGVWALAGCVALPSSGSVHPGPSQVRQDSLDLDLLAAGPQPGATQSQILQGFIDAATDPQNGYQVARAFLTTDEAARWRPGAGATLDQSAQRRTTTTAPTTMQVTVAPVASVGAAGDYAQLASPSPITLTYQFAKVGNEWRIAGAPPGVLIDEQNFPRVFRSHTLYFFDPSFTYAVPDVRWFAGRDSVQTSIVRALVAGPVGWLQGAVLTGFPTGARLDPDAVPLDGTTAVVALSSPTVTAEAEARMVFQLSASLGDVPTIASVRLLLNGTPQDVKPTSVQVPGTVPANDTVYTANGFVTLRATDATGIPVPGLTAQLGGIVPTAAAGDGSNFVFAARGVLYRARPSGAPAELGPALTVPPVTDRFGYAWVADASTIIGYPERASGLVPVSVGRVHGHGRRRLARRRSARGPRHDQRHGAGTECVDHAGRFGCAEGVGEHGRPGDVAHRECA